MTNPNGVQTNQNGVSTTKTNGGVSMTNLFNGFNVFNAYGEVVSYENPNHLKTELDLVCITLKQGDKVSKHYSLPSPVYRSYHQAEEVLADVVNVSFANGFVENVMTQVAKTEANKQYEEEKQKRHAIKPLSQAALNRKLFESSNMLSFIKKEDVISMEIVTIELNERILIVAENNEGYPTAHSVNLQTFKFLEEKDLKEQYDMLLFTDRTALYAKRQGQTVNEKGVKITRDYGYGVAFKDIHIIQSHLLANAHADEETLLKWLDAIHAEHLTRKQHTVYHVSIKDIKPDDYGNYHYTGVPVINEFASSSYLLETLESKNYQPVVLDADLKKDKENFGNTKNDKLGDLFESVKENFIDNVFRKGFYMEISGEQKLFRRTLQSSSQARTIKITCSDCPEEKFWELREQLSYGLIKEGDNLEPNKAEKRFGMSSSTSIPASRKYKAVVIDDLEKPIKQNCFELVHDKEKSDTHGKPIFKVKRFEGTRKQTSTDGAIFYSHAVAAQFAFDFKTISYEELQYWLEKTCTLVQSEDSKRKYEIIDCKDMDQIQKLITKDKRLKDIFNRILVGSQLRLQISDKGFGVLVDIKKYWGKLHEEIIKRYKKENIPVPNVPFNPELLFVFESSHKLKTKDVIYDTDVRICNNTYAANKKDEFSRLSVQAFFSLALEEEVINEIADEELQKLEKVFNSLNTAIEVTKFYGQNEVNTRLNAILTLEKEVAEAAFKNSNIQLKLYEFVEKQLEKLQFGQLLVKAETHYITCDPLAYFEPEKALQPREAFFADQDGVRLNPSTNGFVGLIRHPHLNRTEKARVKLVDRKELWYLRNILVINACDDTFLRMGGADVDGDKVMVIFDERVVKNTTFFKTFIQQGISTEEKIKAGMIKGKQIYYYDDEAIFSAHKAGTEGTEIGEATNTILRTTELFLAKDISPLGLDKDIETFRKEIYTSMVQLCCMSGQLIDQAGIPQEERLYMEDYEADYWGKFPFVTKSMVEYRMYKKGIRFDKIDPKYFEKFENNTVVDLDTTFKHIIQRVRNFMNKLTNRYAKVKESSNYSKTTMTTANNRLLCEYVMDRLPKKTEVLVEAIKEIEKIASYWAASASQINTLPNEEDDEKDLVNQAWEQLKGDIRGLLLSVHPDPRICAALTFFYCYGAGKKNSKTRSEGLVWFCLLEEFIEFLSPNCSYMRLAAPKNAVEGDEVFVEDGALFLRKTVSVKVKVKKGDKEIEGIKSEQRDFYINQVGYQLSSNKLEKIGKKLYMTAIRPRSVMFAEPSSLVALNVRENFTDNRLLKLHHQYRLSIQQGKLFIYTMENALVGQVYTTKTRFRNMDNKIIRVERLACGTWQLKDKAPKTITSAVLVAIVGEETNPYAQFQETFIQDNIVAGLAGYVDTTLDEEVTVSDDMIATFKEEEDVWNLMDVELEYGDDADSYEELAEVLEEQAFELRAESSEPITGKLILPNETVIEVFDEEVVEDIDIEEYEEYEECEEYEPSTICW
ncbi:MAG: hypothetical protein IIZ99_04955 [Turicibacter sp.]|nr:hypothetical protein [Turicibacter sp.]